VPRNHSREIVSLLERAFLDSFSHLKTAAE
jgi:hypothetical protein